MDRCDLPFSSRYMLTEKIARHIFASLPQNGSIVVIVDRDGNYWPSNSDFFSALNVSSFFLQQLCAKVDDSTEPILSQLNDSSVVAARLATERTDCGYVFLIMPHRSPESTLENIDLIEMLLSEITLTAALAEKNNLLYELGQKHSDMYNNSEAF
ncbi:MAG: hypothetical protein KAI59_03535 [Planctomycetes bacterium]|nr:hypothetical protein [Planctomycetota bacterium]MCK5473079.1 hypothetical protein [Planctomycetota bacterium]